MKPVSRFAVGALLALVACVPTEEGATPRYTLVMGIDVSGSFHNSGSYDDAVKFAAHYLEAHLNGFGGLQVPTDVFVGSVGGSHQGEAKTFLRPFFRWYNVEHRHGGISMLTPEQVHFGRADEIIARRATVLNTAWTTHPERFVRGVPKPKPLAEAVWINPPSPTLNSQDIAL